MKTIFITGASSGLGKATAKLFQEKGWTVIATMRNPKKETELRELKNVHLYPLDVTNSQQITDTISQILIQFEVDVVFNNAGYGLVGGFEAYSQEDIQHQIETNLLGVLKVAQPFITYFRENKKKGILLTTTSAAGIAANPLASVYSATKFALEGWSEAVNYEVNPFGIQLKTIAPGGMATDYAGRSLNYVQKDAYTSLWNKMIAGFEDGSTEVHFSSAEDVANVVYEAATDNSPKLRYIVGPDAEKLANDRQNLGQQKQFEQISKLYY
ncbi:SDR family oxidoreductase [Leeuwenhoekiella marinoflava]|uniref:Short-subunit dehydrogenase n=2 Tax=Leeuwenhoekiella marinoflava TaxID=988 RepID=A0A4Q0PN29_9FLAO|nr:SDR family oxidoreductase [Leeuwenhoekiella marinoflava]RXG31821.1 short-subunit dehydrogenase [Leeuwenhoekiella marinoflava]SHF03900.1 Short-chain dehydrogenase [Leeuwenhoekiella marinoflava DSM 3653]